ncbi:MAG: HAMP domain-containing histidine kinase [Candidatus Riflebacteria bacterium]|nr:HAMP domain-containing histidine kinase [Candidatus Riflebacteria bacterium]
MRSLYWKICGTFVLVVLVSVVAGVTTFQAVWGRLIAHEVETALQRGLEPAQVGPLLRDIVKDQPEVIAVYHGPDGSASGANVELVTQKAPSPDRDAGTEARADPLTRLEAAGFITRIEMPGNRGSLVVGHRPVVPDLPDRDELDRHLMQAGAAALTVVLLVAIVLGLVTFWVIARRLRELGTCLGAVAEGELSRRIPSPGKDEIGHLGHSFNRMAQRLQEVVSNLEQVDVKRREFLADVSHELRTPLTSVRANLESLLPRRSGQTDGPPDAAAAAAQGRSQAVAMSLEEVEHMACLVEDLLELARMESPEYRLVREEVVIQRVVADVISRLRTSIDNRRIQVVTRFSPDPLRREVDPRRIGQVVTNLLVNSIRSLDQGGTIEVRVAEEEGRGLIELGDTGPGIPEQQREHLFEPFHTTSRGGTGLGLAIVSKLVAAHGGQVELTARPGGGTLARVLL